MVPQELLVRSPVTGAATRWQAWQTQNRRGPMKIWMNLIGATGVVACLAVPAYAAMPSDWDKNADASLTRDEFDARFTALGVFGKLDTDKNGMISQAEWTAGTATLGDAFKNRFAPDAASDPFKTWNMDAQDGLTEKEFYDGIYAVYDDNRDKTIQEAEFSDINMDTGTTGFWKG